MTKWITAVAAAASLAAAADAGRIAGPVAGFVFDARAGVIRPIEGLPGAARLGAPLPLPFRAGLAAPVSRRDFALVAPAGGGPPVLALGLRSPDPAIREIPGALAPSAISLARDGAAAFLYSASARRFQFLDGLPAAPRASDPVDADFLGEAPAAIALDPAGASALLAAADGRIYRVRRDPGAPAFIATLRGVSSLSILPGRDAALAASAETGDVLLIDGLDAVVSVRSVAGPSTGIASARAVLALDDRRAAVIAGDGRLAIVDLDAGSLEWIPLAADALDFDPLDRSLFALNRAGNAPLLLLDAANGTSAWFVPPVHPAARPRGLAKNRIRGEDRHF